MRRWPIRIDSVEDLESEPQQPQAFKFAQWQGNEQVFYRSDQHMSLLPMLQPWFVIPTPSTLAGRVHIRMVSLRLLADSLLRHIAKTVPSVTSSSGLLAAECHIQSMPPSYYFVDASICMLHLRLISRLLNPVPCLPLVPLTVFSLLIHHSVFSFAILAMSLLSANYTFIQPC